MKPFRVAVSRAFNVAAPTPVSCIRRLERISIEIGRVSNV